MTTVAVAPDEAHARAESAIKTLGTEALKFLEENHGETTLVELISHLRTLGEGPELVSRALATLLSANELVLTSDRRVLRPQ